MDKEIKSAAGCKRCGKPVDSGEIYCSQCIIELAEEDITESEEIPRVERPKKSRVKAVVQCFILLVCIAIIAIQIPKLISAFEKDKPVRYGTYSTDAKTDQCINNLWQISKLLQEKRLPADNIVCPASGKPYVVTNTGEDIVVSCPAPGLYGFSIIKVSKKHPVPEIKK
ncbi:MAG: hypothetical protein U9M96_02770 [Thermodesulfobacteriota bacterium]|nr:hypothetical protein [Thermodesulfobacteriota bacterium]